MKIPKYSCGTDDITFCLSNCENMKCFRHPYNIIDKTIPHSFSNLDETELCPSYVETEEESE